MTPLISSQPSSEIRFQQLLREARQGSTEARWLVVQLFRKMMLAIANEEVNLAIQAREAPSDIVQETILEAQNDLDRFRGMTEQEMRHWLKSVLKRNILNLHQKYRTHKRDLDREQSISAPNDPQGPTVVPDPAPSASTILLRRERTQRVKAAIRGLPQPSQLIIELHYRKGLSFHQIDIALGCPAKTSQRMHARALIELSKKLGAE